MSPAALLDARISQLENGAEPPHAPAGPAVVTSLAAAALTVAAGAWSVVIIAHYMPACAAMLR